MKIEIKLCKEQFDLLLNSLVQVAQGVYCLSDAWEGKGKESDIIGDIFDDKPTRKYVRHKDEVSCEKIFKEIGAKQDSGLFRAACKLAGTTPFSHEGNSKRLYIPATYKEAVIIHLKGLVD